MNVAIETRELITVAAGEARLQGTYHKCGSGGPVDLARNRAKPTGVLFFNSGFLPRAAGADCAVYWADCFARSGYPSFRLDLPGLGDSGGELPEPILDFVNGGGYAPVLAAAVKELVSRFGLAGMVIVGHCAGAVTALHAGGSIQECRGLVLTDPYFHLEHEKPKIVVAVKELVMGSRLGTLTRYLFHGLRSVYLAVKRLPLAVRFTNLPRNANLPLLNCWSQAVSAGKPILVMQSPRWTAVSAKPGIGQFDYLGYLQGSAGPNPRTVVKLLEGIDHSFADGPARAAVREQIEQWLAEFFPAAETEDSFALNNLQPVISE